MKNILTFFALARLLGLCLIGLGASLLGLHRIDEWAAKQIEEPREQA